MSTPVFPGFGGEGSPFADVQKRIQERVAAARARMEELRKRFMGGTEPTPQRLFPQGKFLSQMPRLAKFRRTGGVIGNLGLGRRIVPQTSRPPGMHQQNISPTAQRPAIADDIYQERLRAESSPGLSVSL